MPTYDQEAFLPTAVASVLAQQEQDWELVVVDDGSPGPTRAALGPALDDPRVRLHRLPRNRGLGAALNAGLNLTSGELVAYLPTDDLWFTEHLSDARRALEARLMQCCAAPGSATGSIKERRWAGSKVSHFSWLRLCTGAPRIGGRSALS